MLALLVSLLFAAPVPPPIQAPAMTAPTVRYADLTVHVERGRLSVVSVTTGHFEKPTALRRYRGRFVVRVLAAKKPHEPIAPIAPPSLAPIAPIAPIEEVRFDFPLLAPAESEDTGSDHRALAERLRAGVTATTTVRVPLADGSSALELYDSETRKTIPVAIPTAAIREPSAAAAGAPRAP